MFSQSLKAILLLTAFLLASASIAADGHNYLIGTGKADVTGPAFGSPMWGYSKPGQNTEGIHTRLNSRAFVFVDPKNQGRLLFASVDIGNIEHHVFLEVLDRLESKYGDLYNRDNTIISATHTHSGPDGYSHTRAESGLIGLLNPEHFNRVVSGIVKSIDDAHNNLQPADILLNKGEVNGAGANRSMTAYNANPEQERARYKQAMDLNMTLLRLQGEANAIGSINWFSVHPTSMTFNNKLISSDHKGYASLTWEQNSSAYKGASLGKNFIAAFAQSTPGDVTPNLNLDNTGPGTDDIDSTQIIGQRQLDAAQSLFNEATDRIIGPISSRQLYVDMSNLKISGEFTGGAGDQVTCPSAYGYSFAAGSTEDGGGHFLFSEGMTKQKWWLDFIIRMVTGTEDWTQAVKDCQSPKAILFETGTGEVPLQSQIRSLTISRIGSLAIVAMPTEITTMSARRIRSALKTALGSEVEHLVIAGYSNGYAGYITTPEEYETQQYEGGHTVHGKWTLPAYIQSLTQLAAMLNSQTDASAEPGVVDRSRESQVQYDDWRGKARAVNLFADLVDEKPAGKNFGDVVDISKESVSPGETITIKFWSGNPSTGYRDDDTFVLVERNEGGNWVPLLSDAAWSTIIRWDDEGDALIATVSWTVPDNMLNGNYRIKHLGNYRVAGGKYTQFESAAAEFSVTAAQ